MLAGAVAVLLIVPAAPAVAQRWPSARQLDRWEPDVAEASRRSGIPEDWIRRVMRAESAGMDVLFGQPITSPAGAMGLMQIMPRTWAELRARYGLRSDPYDTRDNILVGAAYLRELYDRFGYPNLFAAYNAGPERVDMYLLEGRPLPGETVGYLAKIGQGEAARENTDLMPSGASLFFQLRSGARSPGSPAVFPVSSSGGLFVPLRTSPGHE